MNWIKNNLGFVLIIIGVLAYVMFSVIKPVDGHHIIGTDEYGEENLNTIKVEIKGEVISPGIYSCYPNDRVIDLIKYAGGLTTDADIDKINRSEKLSDEMIIQIPKKVIKNDDVSQYVRYIRVEIKGEVFQPGIYKCPENAILYDLIQMAGGFTNEANRDDINLAVKLEDGQSYDIDHLSTNHIYVEIRGAINYPGVYQMTQGDMVIDLVNQAGGLIEGANIGNISMVDLLNDHDLVIIETNETINLELAVDIKGAVVNPGVYYMHPGDRIIDVVYKAGGFISNADIRDVNLSQLIHDEELIHIPTIKDKNLIVVDVKGEVKYPGVYYLEPGSRVIDAIQLAGGFRYEADTSIINLSKIIDDQEMIIIPKISDDETYIYVEIKGEVFIPGIYAMKPSDRLVMLINRAGGFTKDASTNHLNLSRLLNDEESILVPSIHDDMIYISIVGEVHLPGNYEVSEYTSIEQIIHMAGGLTNQADITKIDLNQVISQGSTIIIPSVNDSIPTLPEEINGLININTASSEQLQTLNGIGIILSERIIEYRINHGPFQSITELLNVSGIGDSIYEDIKDDITV